MKVDKMVRDKRGEDVVVTLELGPLSPPHLLHATLFLFVCNLLRMHAKSLPPTCPRSIAFCFLLDVLVNTQLRHFIPLFFFLIPNRPSFCETLAISEHKRQLRSSIFFCVIRIHSNKDPARGVFS